jgi:hypothetical protein
METSNEINEITAALSSVMAEIKDVVKDVKGYGYKYAAIDSYLTIARPLLAKYGLALIQMPSATAEFVTVTTMLSHTSGQWIRGSLSLPMEMKKGLSLAQCVGMLIAYARRYSLAAMVNMAAEDNDADVGERDAGGKDEGDDARNRIGGTRDVYAELMRAVDADDGWHVLAIAQDQPAFRLAYGRLTGAQKKACKEQEQRAASARFDYANNLLDYAQSGDELGTQQLLAELGENARAKQMVWDQLDSATKAFIKKLKEAA